MNKKKIGLVAAIAAAVIVIIIVVIILIPKEKNIKYEVIVDSGTLNTINVNKSKTRKQEIVKQRDSYFLIVHEAEQDKQYTLEVASVSTTKEEIKVVVKMVAGTLDVKSNPKAVIKLNKKPKKINVIYR